MTGASLRDRASRAAHGALTGLRRPATIACAYAAIGILTFGHCAAQSKTCWRVSDQTKIACPNAIYAIDGIVAGVLWPLYWSWELQQ